MIVDDSIRQAIEFETDMKTPVLSLYLNVDPSRRSLEKYKLAARNLLDQADGAAEADLKQMERHIETGYDRQGRSLVMFSCAARDFWWANSYMVPVEDGVFVGRRSYVRQLAALMDAYERYGVIHVDQEGARLYRFHMGVLEDVEGVLGEDVKHHRSGGRAAPRYQRHEQEIAQQNLQEAAEFAEKFYQGDATNRLILAGTEKNTARFQSMLSPRLRDMLVGQIAVGANASPDEISDKALKLAQKAADEDADTMAERVVNTLHQRGPAVSGLAETLTAVQNGRAEHVIVLSNFAQPAYRFVDSGTILLDLEKARELGSGRVQELPDAVESVLRRAMAQGIGVTILDEHDELATMGKIAALTRY